MPEPKRFSARRTGAEAKPFILEYEREVKMDSEGNPLPADADAAEVARTEVMPEEAEFTAVAQASPAAILDFTEKVEPETGARPAAALAQFLKDVLIPEDVARFDELVHDKAVRLDVAALGEVTTWLMELYTKRPTLPR